MVLRHRVCAAASLLAVATPAAALPTPFVLWTMQEATGQPRVSSGTFPYALVDGNASAPIEQASDGVFGPFSAYFPVSGTNNSQRLYISRPDAPAITSGIAGPTATVTAMVWIKPDSDTSGGMIAGVWNEHIAARQYAIFTALGTCAAAPVYNHGAAAHISAVGGPTPGNRFCITAACDPQALEATAWHCVANVYNGSAIAVYVNGTLHANGAHNPYPYPDGIFSPEGAGVPGSDFGVGANMVNETVGGPPLLANRYKGRVGGIAVWAQALSDADVGTACALAPLFR